MYNISELLINENKDIGYGYNEIDTVDKIVDIEVMCEYKGILFMVETLKLKNNCRCTISRRFRDEVIDKFYYHHILFNRNNNKYLSFVSDRKFKYFDGGCDFIDDVCRCYHLEFCKDKKNDKDLILIEHVPFMGNNYDRFYIDVYDFDFNKQKSVMLSSRSKYEDVSDFYIRRERLDFITENITVNKNNFSYLKFPNKDKYVSKNTNLDNLITLENREYQHVTHFNNDLALVEKNGQIGVINRDYSLLFQFDPKIIDVKIISDKVLLITNDRMERAIYNVYSGYVNNFSKEIFDIIQILPDIYDIQMIDDKHKLLINNQVKNDSLCDSIIVVSDNIIGLKSDNGTRLIDKKYNKITFSNNSFKIGENVYSFYDNDLSVNNDLDKPKVYKKEW